MGNNTESKSPSEGGTGEQASKPNPTTREGYESPGPGGNSANGGMGSDKAEERRQSGEGN